MPGAGHSAASPSDGNSSAERIDLALQRIVGLARPPADLKRMQGLAAKPRWCYSKPRDAPPARLLPVHPLGRLTQR